MCWDFQVLYGLERYSGFVYYVVQNLQSEFNLVIGVICFQSLFWVVFFILLWRLVKVEWINLYGKLFGRDKVCLVLCFWISRVQVRSYLLCFFRIEQSSFIFCFLMVVIRKRLQRIIDNLDMREGCWLVFVLQWFISFDFVFIEVIL